MTPLHPRQQAILAYLKLHAAEHSYGPSRRDIAAATGITSLSVIDHHLSQLAHRGLIRIDHAKARAIVLLDVQGAA